MTNADLATQCFQALNSFKRHRALGLIRRKEGSMVDAQLHELKSYQEFDNLELGLRALQKSIYETTENKGEEKNV